MPLPILLIILFLIVMYPLARGARSLAPWVPTKHHDVARLCHLLHLTKSDIFVELGCGNGRVCNAVAQRFPSAQIIGIEIAWPLAYVARFRARSLPNSTIICTDALTYSLSSATVIYIFGMPHALAHTVTKKLLAECKKGTRVISYSFRFHELPLVATHKPEGMLALYEYVIS